MTGQALMHPVTGEVIDLRHASLAQIAEMAVETQDIGARLRDFQQELNDALLDHLDQNAMWTMRVGDIEITAKSPSAGTTVYPSGDLERELTALVERGTITLDAAGKALKRQVTLTLDIPLHLPLKETADGLSRITVSLGENELPIAKVDYDARSVDSGIKALRKVPGTAAALDRAMATKPVGERRAKVVVKEKS